MHKVDDQHKIRKLRREAAYKEFLQDIKSFLPKLNLPSCFISYAWDDSTTQEGRDKNKIWHERLSKIKNDFKLLGVEVFLDIYDMNNQLNLTMADNIERSRFIFLIGTKRLKLRLTNEHSPAAFEYKRIQEKLARTPSCVLAPLLLEGDIGDSFPEEISQQFFIRDMKSDEAHEHVMASLSNPMGLIACVFELNCPAADAAVIRQYKICVEKLYKAYALIEKDCPREPEIAEKFVPLSSILTVRAMSSELRYMIALGVATDLAQIHQYPYERKIPLSLETILVDVNHHFKHKITGFNLSKDNPQNDSSKKGNIYNLGIIFWEIITGQKHDPSMRMSSPALLLQAPVKFSDIIRLCCSDDPDARPNAQAIVDYLKRNQYGCTNATLLQAFKSPAQQSTIIFDSATKLKESGNLTQAFNLYLLAAELGNMSGEANVGSILLQGLGNIPVDKQKAFKHLENAANHGEPRAQNNLARMYETGDGVQQNRIEAISWYQRAASQSIDVKAKQVAEAKLQQLRK